MCKAGRQNAGNFGPVQHPRDCGGGDVPSAGAGEGFEVVQHRLIARIIVGRKTRDLQAIVRCRASSVRCPGRFRPTCRARAVRRGQRQRPVRRSFATCRVPTGGSRARIRFGRPCRAVPHGPGAGSRGRLWTAIAANQPFVDHAAHGPSDIFDRDQGIAAVCVVKWGMIQPETFERAMHVERQPLCPRASTILAGFEAAGVGVPFGVLG